MKLYKTVVLIALTSTTINVQCLPLERSGFATVQVAGDKTTGGAKGYSMFPCKTESFKFYRQQKQKEHDEPGQILKEKNAATTMSVVAYVTPVRYANTIIKQITKHIIHIRAPSKDTQRSKCDGSSTTISNTAWFY